MASISTISIVKSFASTSVLKGVSLDIADGEFLTLLGPSGCGKSTLLRIIAGLEAADSGTIEIGGRSVDNLRPKNRDVAMVFQSYALYPHMTVAQNMALPLKMRYLSAFQRFPLAGRFIPGTQNSMRRIEREVRSVAEAIGIGHLLDRKPGQLSGGQRQRVAVGRALVRNPAIFLMDEPLSNLDAKLRVQMRAELKELHQRLQATIIYVTHDQAEAMTLSDRVAVMLDGELLQVGPPQAIYADPDNRRVAEFVGSPKINMLDATVRDGGVVEVGGSTLDVDLEWQTGATVTLGIRPEAFHVAERGGPGAITGSIRLIEHMGSDLFVHLDVPGSPEPLIARLLAERARHVAMNQTLHLGVRPDRVLPFAEDGRRIRVRATVTPLKEYAR